MQTIYVTGHKNPDTDSIAGAIAMAVLKQKQGMPAKACRLSEINAESRFALARFGFEPPQLLKDGRNTLGEIELDPVRTLDRHATAFDALQLMRSSQKKSVCVQDEQGVLCGILTLSDFTALGLGDTAESIERLSRVSLHNIVRTIDGQLIYDPGTFSINGKVSIPALTKKDLSCYDIRGRIVIVSDDPKAQKQFIAQGAGLLILVWCAEVESDVLETARQYRCPIVMSGQGAMNTSRYLYFSVALDQLMHTNPMAFSKDSYVDDVLAQVRQVRYRSFPVIDENGHPVGMVERYHLLTAPKKQLILVDHNEFSQSVPHVEMAEVLEVVDHHRISNFYTQMPVSFRAERKGSTCTILARMFQERSLEIDPKLAGLMCCAILSDTLHFQSVTTTQDDLFMAGFLARIARVDLDGLAREMFTTSCSVQGDLNHFLFKDTKSYTLCGHPFAVSQCFSVNAQALQSYVPAIMPLLEQACTSPTTHVLILTFLEEKGSMILCTGAMKHKVRQLFDTNCFYPDLLSRKKQILPLLEQQMQLDGLRTAVLEEQPGILQGLGACA